MKIADKLPTVVEGAQKIYDEVVGQSDLIAQIKAKVNSLPEAGGGEKPTLFAPTIKLNSVSSELTITDNRNGDFVPWYDLYIGGKKITTLTSKTATLTDYIEHTETMNVYVQSNLTNFNSIESNVVEWKIINVAGTPGLVYNLSDDGTYVWCAGIGEAIETDIELATEYEGMPVQSIGNGAFQRCTTITSVVIPSSVKRIGTYAFESCSKLTSVVIYDGVTTINDGAFYNCTKLKRVDFSSHTAIPTLGSSAFSSTHANLQIKVPANLIDKWKTATNWSNYASKIVTEFTNTL